MWIRRIWNCQENCSIHVCSSNPERNNGALQKWELKNIPSGLEGKRDHVHCLGRGKWLVPTSPNPRSRRPPGTVCGLLLFQCCGNVNIDFKVNIDSLTECCYSEF